MNIFRSCLFFRQSINCEDSPEAPNIQEDDIEEIGKRVYTTGPDKVDYDHINLKIVGLNSDSINLYKLQPTAPLRLLKKCESEYYGAPLASFRFMYKDHAVKGTLSRNFLSFRFIMQYAP